MKLREVEALARRDGLKERLRVKFQPGRSFYNIRTGETVIDSTYETLEAKAKALTHEVKHNIDLQHVSPNLLITFYLVFIWTLLIETYLHLGIWLALLSGPILYNLNPFEISANLYSRRHWREYMEALRKDVIQDNVESYEKERNGG